ncbi:hypothetical protein EGW08_007058, partial [Elysia chlorotica]
LLIDTKDAACAEQMLVLEGVRYVVVPVVVPGTATGHHHTLAFLLSDHDQHHDLVSLEVHPLHPILHFIAQDSVHVRGYSFVSVVDDIFHSFQHSGCIEFLLGLQSIRRLVINRWRTVPDGALPLLQRPAHEFLGEAAAGHEPHQAQPLIGARGDA